MRTHILKDGGDTPLTKIFYDDGAQTDPGSVTVQVWRADGTELTAGPQAATKAGSSSTASFTFTLPGSWLTQVDVLQVDWIRGDTGGVDRDFVDVVGAYLFSVEQARSFDAAAFADTSRYPTSRIVDERLRITALLEDETGVSWVPRYGEHTVDGDGRTRLLLPHTFVNQLLSVRIDDTAVTVSDVTITGRARNILHYSSGWTAGTANVTVRYEYGHSRPVDGVDRIGLILLRDRLAPSNVPHRAWKVANEFGETVFAQPGAKRPTGIPEVDRWISDHDLRLGFA